MSLMKKIARILKEDMKRTAQENENQNNDINFQQAEEYWNNILTIIDNISALSSSMLDKNIDTGRYSPGGVFKTALESVSYFQDTISKMMKDVSLEDGNVYRGVYHMAKGIVALDNFGSYMWSPKDSFEYVLEDKEHYNEAKQVVDYFDEVIDLCGKIAKIFENFKVPNKGGMKRNNR